MRGRRSRAALGLLAVAAVGLIGFGSHALGFLDAVGEQQQLVAMHSVPAETARLFGLSGTPSWWRHLFVGGFAVVLAYALWRTARGADWRVGGRLERRSRCCVSTAWLLPWYAIWPLPLAAVSGDRRLRAATLLFCAYAVLIHLPLADPLLSPARHRVAAHLHVADPRPADTAWNSPVSRSFATCSSISAGEASGRSRRRRIASRRLNLRISST